MTPFSSWSYGCRHGYELWSGLECLSQAHETLWFRCEGAPSAAVLPSRAVTGVAHVDAPAAEGPQPPLQLPGAAATFSQLPNAQASPPTQPFGMVRAQHCGMLGLLTVSVNVF